MVHIGKSVLIVYSCSFFTMELVIFVLFLIRSCDQPERNTCTLYMLCVCDG